MKFKICNIFMTFFLMLVMSFATYALDYKNWIPVLPEKIGGLEKAAEPNGANVNQGKKSWATLQQRYSDNSGKSLQLTIVDGSISPQIQQFKSMKQFAVETENKVIESVEVSGYESVIELDKAEGGGSLLILVQENRVVAIEAGFVSSKKELISLADDVPLSKIAAN